MHPKKARRGVAFGVAGFLVCRRRERLRLSRLDTSAFARPSARQATTPWAQRKFNSLGVDGVLVVSTRMGATAGYGLGQARHRPAHYLEVGDL
jgi:hypothetical protein